MEAFRGFAQLLGRGPFLSDDYSTFVRQFLWLQTLFTRPVSLPDDLRVIRLSRGRWACTIRSKRSKLYMFTIAV